MLWIQICTFVVLSTCLLVPEVVNAWSYGELLPVSFHLRLKRTAAATDIPRGADDMIEVKETKNNQWLITRPLPPDNSPRFAINTRAHQPSTRLFEYATNATKQEGGSISDVAVRFQIERGLAKSTAWYPLMKTIIKKITTGKRKSKVEHSKEEHYLAGLNFHFGYQSGTFHKITSFRVEPTYSKVKNNDLELHYQWTEQRTYNPHIALCICSLVAVIAASSTLSIIFTKKTHLTKAISKKEVRVKNHKQ
ncbi:hypothetical protein DPX39_100026100 [Trypanosoma brucei equiperdum]|uniref:Uncharacterized protein n=1 Tax=Trypanosoma brucei equiperdum TaxID=630700 RepID=A0A3L6L157_9TRYP|nr:hypothetical protein DPX39_100026100 [Trypanosoma brucei equiperdum]